MQYRETSRDRSAWIWWSVAAFALGVTSVVRQLLPCEDSTVIKPAGSKAAMTATFSRSVGDSNTYACLCDLLDQLKAEQARVAAILVKLVGDPNGDPLHALMKRIKIEQARPLAKQDYTEVKSALVEMMTKGGRSGLYARYVLEWITHLEPDERTIEEKYAELRKRPGVITTSDALGARIQAMARCIAVGTLEPCPAGSGFCLFDAQEMICRIMPLPSMAEDCNKYVGRCIGVAGEIIAPESVAETISVSCTEIVPLDE